MGDHFAKPSGLFPEMNPQPSTLPLKTISHSRRASTTNTTDFIRKVTNGSIHRAPSRRPSLSEGRVAVRGFTWPTNPGCGASDSSCGFFRALAVDVLTAAQRRSRRSGMCSNLRRTGKSLLMHRQPGCCFVAWLSRPKVIRPNYSAGAFPSAAKGGCRWTANPQFRQTLRIPS